MSDAEKLQWILIVLLLVDTVLVRARCNRIVKNTNSAVASHKEAIVAMSAEQTKHAEALHLQGQAISHVTTLYMEAIGRGEGT